MLLPVEIKKTARPRRDRAPRQPYDESRAQRAPSPPRPPGEGRGEGSGHGEQLLSWSGVALIAMAVTMKVARSALHFPLALRERAGVRETATASSSFHGLGWR